MEPESAETMSGKRSVMPAGVDAGAVQRHAGGAADGVEPGALVGGRVEPAQRRHHVLARLQEPGHDVDVGEDRAVDDAVGVERQERLDVAGGGDPDRSPSDERADVDAVLVGRVHPAARDLEIRVVQDPLDGGPADVAGRPLHDAIGHGSPPGGAGWLTIWDRRRRAHYVPFRRRHGVVIAPGVTSERSRREPQGDRGVLGRPVPPGPGRRGGPVRTRRHLHRHRDARGRRGPGSRRDRAAPDARVRQARGPRATSVGTWWPATTPS